MFSNVKYHYRLQDHISADTSLIVRISIDYENQNILCAWISIESFKTLKMKGTCATLITSFYFVGLAEYIVVIVGATVSAAPASAYFAWGTGGGLLSIHLNQI